MTFGLFVNVRPAGEPAGRSDSAVKNAEGKDWNVFRGDYTGLAVDPDGSALSAPDPRRAESLWPAMAISPSGVVYMST